MPNLSNTAGGGKRALVGVLGLALLFGVLLYGEATRPPYADIAEAHLGEHWYRIQIGEQHVGYMYNKSHRDWRGDQHFETTTHFLSEDNVPSTITKHLTFGAKPPHALLRATYHETSATQRQATLIKSTPAGSPTPYLAVMSRNGATNSVALDWQFTLPDFLAFETWLATTRPATGTSHLVQNLDFERLRVTQRSYRVVAENTTGYLVETAAPFAPTQTQLNARFVPQHLTMAGVFNIRLSTEAEAIALKTLRNKTSYLFALDQRLSSQQRIEHLILHTEPPPPPHFPAEFAIHAGRAATTEPPSNFAGEALRYPITHADIQMLVRRAQAQTGVNGDLIAQLMQEVNRQVRYEEDNPAGSVLSALARGTGECTDFADLLTTLARAAHLPARTIYGIAYKDGAHPAMMFHAWNEIYYRDSWQVVDPTWGQRIADATHVALSEQQAAVLMLMHIKQPLSFSVAHIEYAQAGATAEQGYAH